MKNDLAEMLKNGMTKEELEKEFKDQLAAAVNQVEQEKKEEKKNLLAEARHGVAEALAKYMPLALGVEDNLSVAEYDQFLRETEHIVTISIKDYMKPAESAVTAKREDEKTFLYHNADQTLADWLKTL